MLAELTIIKSGILYMYVFTDWVILYVDKINNN